LPSGSGGGGGDVRGAAGRRLACAVKHGRRATCYDDELDDVLKGGGWAGADQQPR
jgi:hypothetical protein